MNGQRDEVEQLERAVLGALLLDSRAAWPDVASRITERDFASVDHRLIFRVIAAAAAAGEWLDAVTAADALERLPMPALRGDAAGILVKTAGGLAYLIELAREVPGVANAGTYAARLRDRSLRRGLAVTLRGHLERLESGEAQLEDLVGDIAADATEVAAGLAPGGDRGLGDAVCDALLDFEDRVERRKAGGIVGISTGLPRLDRLLGGFQCGALYVLAGLTSTGKTAAGLAFAVAAARTGVPVGLVSREMTATELASRLCSNVHGVPLRGLFGGDPEALRALSERNIAAPMQALPIRIDDCSSRLEEVAARIRTWTRKHGVRLVVIDYLQLVTATAETRTLEVAAISRRLKALAMQERIAVVALSQFNRQAAAAGQLGDRPELHHLRDSGSVEQDADAVLVLWRSKAQRDADAVDKSRELVLTLLKNRQGPIGDVYSERTPLVFDVALQRFHESDPQVSREIAAAPSSRGRMAKTHASESVRPGE